MLRRADLQPLPGRGRFRCTHCGNRILDMRDACTGLQRGHEIFPADAVTAESVAKRLDEAGNAARASVIRLWAATAFPESPAA